MDIHFKTLGSAIMRDCDINNNGFTKKVFIFESYKRGNLKTKNLCIISFRSKSTNESIIPSNIFIPE